MTVIGSAWIEIKPMTTGFGVEAEAQVKRALAGVRAEIELSMDATGFRQKVAAAVDAATAGISADIELDVDTAGLRDRIELALLGLRADIDLDVDIAALRQRINAALIGITGDIDLDLDVAAMRLRIIEALRGINFSPDIDTLLLRAKLVAALHGFTVHIDADFDTASLRAKLILAARGITINVDVNIDAVALRAKLRAAILSAGIQTIDLHFNIDVARLRAQLAAAIAAASAGQNANIGGNIGGGAGGGIRGLLAGLAIPLLDSAVGIITSLISALLAAGQAVFAFSSSLGSLVGIAATVPSVLGAILQSVAAIGLAFGGIGDAIKASAAAEKAAGVAGVSGGGVSAVAQARAIESAQRGVADAFRSSERAVEAAQRGVAEASRSAADAVESASRRQEEAGRGLIQAQRSQQRAQEDLSRARREAIEDLEDLRSSVQRLALDEEQARERLRVARIRADLEERRAVGDLRDITEEAFNDLLRQATEDPRRDAALDLRDAELDLQEVLERQADAREELNDAEARGVEGARKVVDARESLADANLALADAQREVADSARDLARAQEDGARRIQEAQERLADAQEDGARRVAEAQERLADAYETAAGGSSAAQGAADRYQAALDRLGPAQRRFTEFLVGLRPLIRELQEDAASGLFPGVEEGITRMLPLVDDFRPILISTGKAIGGLTVELATLVSSPAFRSDLVSIGRGNIEIIKLLGGAGITTVDSLRLLTVAGQPLAIRLSEIIGLLAGMVNESLRVSSANGSLEAYFGRLELRIEKVLITAGFLGSALLGVFREATPAGDRYLDTLLRLSARLDLIVERASKSGAIKEFFESGRPAAEELARLIGAIVESLFRIGGQNFGLFLNLSAQIRNELLPAIEKAAGALDGRFLQAIVGIITQLVNFYAVFIAGNPALLFLVQTLGNFLGLLVSLGEDIPVISPLLVTLVGALIALRVAVSAISLFRFIAGLTTLNTLVGSGVLAAGVKGLGAAFGFAGVVVAVVAALQTFGPSVDKSVRSIIGAKDSLHEFEKQADKLSDPGFWSSIGRSFKLLFTDPLGFAFDDVKVHAIKTGVAADELFLKLAEKSPAAAQSVITAMQKAGQETATYENILQTVIRATAQQGISEEEVAAKIKAATEAIKGKVSAQDIYVTSLQTINGLLLEQSNAEIASRDAVDALSAAVAKNGQNFDISSAAGRENLRLRNDMISALGRETQALVDSAAKGLLDVAAKDSLIARLKELTTSQYPGVKEAAQRYLEIIDAIPKDKATTFRADTGGAVAAIQSLVNDFGLLQSTANITVRIFGTENAHAAIEALRTDANNIFAPGGGSNTSGLSIGSGDTLHAEFGARVKRGVPIIVGEKRPELFIPDSDGEIVPRVPPIRDGIYEQVSASVESLDMRLNLAIIPQLAPIEGPLPSLTADLDRLEINLDGVVEALRSLESTLVDLLADGFGDGAIGSRGGDRSVTINNTFVLPDHIEDVETVAAAVGRRMAWQLDESTESAF